jgi:hypothetical protein
MLTQQQQLQQQPQQCTAAQRDAPAVAGLQTEQQLTGQQQMQQQQH